MQQQSAGRGLRIAAWVLVPLGLVLVLGAVGGIVLGGGLDGERVTVRGDAMRPTYSPGERLTVMQVGEGEIRRGDVVLVSVPGRYGNAPVLQRVIGLGGDHVESRDGVRVAVNGKRIDEPYVMRDPLGSTGSPYDVTVPEGRLFLLGDNRPNANDSRYFLDEQSGSVAASGVRGRVQDGQVAPLAQLAVAGLGVLLTLVGVGLGIGGFMARAAPRSADAVVPPWAGPHSEGGASGLTAHKNP